MRSVVTVLRCVLASFLGAGTLATAQDQIVGIGLAGAVRESGWIPLQVRLSSTGLAREVEVIGLGVTPDGDVLHTPQRVGVPPSSDVEVSVLALPGPDATQVEVLIKDQDTTVRLVAPMPARIPVASTVVMCVGPIPNGLAQLRDPDPRVRGFTSQVEVNSLTDLNSIPSDWRALNVADVLILPGEGLPSALGSLRWKAVERWVREGGHLVLHGTETGWTFTDPMWCGIDPVRRTHTFAQLREMVSASNALPMLADRRRSVDVLDRSQASFPWSGKMKVADTPLVVGRPWGRGRVDWLGCPLRLPPVTESDGQSRPWPDAPFFADLFILAGDPIPRLAFDASQPSDRLVLWDQSILFGDRDLESMVAESAARSTITNVALLVPLYALLLGPGLALWGRARGRSHQVWPVAAGASLLGVLLMLLLLGRSGVTDVSLRHFTMLDQTFDGPHQVVGFGQVQTTGFSRVDLAHPEGSVRPWIPNGSVLSFPDRRVVESGPTAWSLPTRGVPVPFSWTGSLAPNETWGVVRLKSEPAPYLDLVDKVQGVLVHSFPAPLQQVRLIAVLEDAAPRRRQSVAGEDLSTFADPGRLPVVAFEANIAAPGGWAPGVPLDLSQKDFTQSWSRLDDTLEDRGWRPRESFRGDFGQRPTMNLRNRILDAALWPLAHPTPWLNPGELSMSVSPSVIGSARRFGGGLRLGSPGLMVIGFLDDVPAPGAPWVDGGEPTSSGTVLVRAFLPLPVKER
ncbi:MAG TPA: hypothetical protein DEQ73_01310 [Phycisphaerales bacterium]|nr:hypothetical protein [Phycisphaerales bacterium]